MKPPTTERKHIAKTEVGREAIKEGRGITATERLTQLTATPTPQKIALEKKRQIKAGDGTETREAQQEAKTQALQKQEFFNKVKAFFEKNNIAVEDFSVVKKNTEFDFVITVPSAIGNIRYYCKAKNKKRCSDSDISSAYAQGQLKKLPALFLTAGDLTKKAKEMLEKEFKSVTFRKIES